VNPVLDHVFLGSSVEGKDMVVIDDMLSSGDSILEVAGALKKKNARRVFICETFGLFTDGIEKFDKAYAEGKFDKIITTNLIYQKPELKDRPWYVCCGMSKYLAYIIDTLNHDSSISDLLDPREKILNIVDRYNKAQAAGQKFK
jgi:ribose-phosphate pyrophosphokinase